jgi:transcriptional regulator with XRE-family HTH domain
LKKDLERDEVSMIQYFVIASKAKQSRGRVHGLLDCFVASLLAMTMGLSMANRSPNAIDRQIGVRLRMRRLTLDISQQKLAADLGISFQQLQKYEKGHNRIGAGRLQQIAGMLQVPIAFFYEDFPAPRRGKPALPSFISDFLGSADGLALAEAFVSVRDARQRRCIVILAEAMAR